MDYNNTTTKSEFKKATLRWRSFKRNKNVSMTIQINQDLYRGMPLGFSKQRSAFLVRSANELNFFPSYNFKAPLYKRCTCCSPKCELSVKVVKNSYVKHH